MGSGVTGTAVAPDPTEAAGFTAYIERYKALLQVEKTAVNTL